MVDYRKKPSGMLVLRDEAGIEFTCVKKNILTKIEIPFKITLVALR